MEKILYMYKMIDSYALVKLERKVSPQIASMVKERLEKRLKSKIFFTKHIPGPDGFGVIDLPSSGGSRDEGK